MPHFFDLPLAWENFRAVALTPEYDPDQGDSDGDMAPFVIPGAMTPVGGFCALTIPPGTWVGWVALVGPGGPVMITPAAKDGPILAGAATVLELNFSRDAHVV